MNADLQNLKLLSTFHYVVGGITFLMGFFPFIHLTLGIAMLSGAFPQKPGDEFPETIVGWIFVGLAGFAIVSTWSLAICMLVAGSALSRQRRRMFCLVVAGVECLFVPFGTLLGVFTIVVLQKPSVVDLFTKAGETADGPVFDVG